MVLAVFTASGPSPLAPRTACAWAGAVIPLIPTPATPKTPASSKPPAFRTTPKPIVRYHPLARRSDGAYVASIPFVE
ncbi:hypothetical protein GCM10011497_11910 [Elstera cyanobacteriorum]|nr:hypothetical protein GCM10011497_11910 [Elstera cyanobacteriorum]